MIYVRLGREIEDVRQKNRWTDEARLFFVHILYVVWVMVNPRPWRSGEREVPNVTGCESPAGRSLSDCVTS